MRGKDKVPKLSIMIRTRNEAKQLDALLEQIAGQESVPSYEVILVDNDSSDNIAEIARKHHASLLKISDTDFTYPKAWNLAIPHAKGEFIAFVSAHARLKNNRHYATAVEAFEDDSIAGVYGVNLAMPDAPWNEKALCRIETLILRWGKTKRFTYVRPGVFGTSDAVARGDLLRETLFDERFAAGGEDTEWARVMTQRGNIIVMHKDLAIYHSHYLRPIDQFRQLLYWFNLDKPKAFSREKINRYRSIKY